MSKVHEKPNSLVDQYRSLGLKPEIIRYESSDSHAGYLFKNGVWVDQFDLQEYFECDESLMYDECDCTIEHESHYLDALDDDDYVVTVLAELANAQN